VNYEIDAWNQVHNSVEQAKADKETSIQNTNVFRLTLISSVVNTYFQIASLNEIVDNFTKQYEAAKELAELNEVLYQSGLVDDSVVLNSRNQAEAIYVNLKTAEKQKQVYQFTLAYLMGEYPENFLFEVTARLGEIRYSALVPGAVPAQMLGTRPDVKAAFSSVLSFGFIEKQNIANFLPSLSLAGTYGYANSRIAHLIKHSNALWNYGYHNTVINAFSEVDGSIASYKADLMVLDSQKRQLDNSVELLDIASAQYQAGLTDYINYLTTDLTMLQTDYNLTLKELLLTQDVVTLYKALGLGIMEESDNDGKNS
jgi:multidrug efflux system outer membrane protein